jgi:hypothetical protein
MRKAISACAQRLASNARFAVATRRLLPLRKMPLPRATGLAKVEGQLMVGVADELAPTDSVQRSAKSEDGHIAAASRSFTTAHLPWRRR